MAYRPPQYQYAHTTTTPPHAPHMVVTGTNTTVAYPGHGGVGTVHGDGVIHPNVDGVYVTENYVGPIPQPGGYNQQQYQQQQQYYGGGQYSAPNVIVVGQPTTPTKGGASGTTTATTTAGPSSSYYPTL